MSRQRSPKAHLSRLAIFSALLMVGPGVGAVPTDEPILVVPEDAEAPVDEDLAETLEELAAAGVDPAEFDPRHQLERPHDSNANASGLFGLFDRSAFRLRVDRSRDRTTGLLARSEIRSDGLRWRIRYRRRDRAEHSIAQCLQLNTGAWQLDIGGVGLVHGFGLLVGSPGRGNTVSASQSLAGSRAGVRGWSGDAADRALLGGALSWQDGRWHATVLVGRMQKEDAESHLPALLRIGGLAAGVNLSMLLVSRGAESGISLAGDWRTDRWRLRWETAVWRVDPMRTPVAAWQVYGAWRPSRELTLELLAAATRAQQGNSWGRRPAVMTGWDGYGWVLRTAVRPWPRLRLQALLGRSLRRDRTTGQRRVTAQQLDLRARFRLVNRTTGQLRYRYDQDAAREFSDRFPWQAPTNGALATRSVLSLRLDREQNDWRLTVLARSMGLDGTATAGRRSLLSFTVRRRIHARVSGRLVWATAWGDEVDLVSALVPLSGYVLPRHWGRWRSEIMVGVDIRLAGFELQTAASVRRPKVDSLVTGTPNLSIWCQLMSAW